MTNFTIDDSSLDVASRLAAAKRKTAEPIEPNFLPGLVPGIHLYLGNLPKEFCHVYLEILELTKSYDPLSDDQAAKQAALTRIELAHKMFSTSLRKYFGRSSVRDKTQDFVICSGWKVSLRGRSTEDKKSFTG